MRPVSVAFLYSSFLFFVFFFASDAEIGFALSLAPSPLTPPRLPMPEIRDGLNSLPLRPLPLPTRCIPRYYGASTIYSAPTVFFFSRDGLSSTCLSVRLSVSASLCSLQFCFSCSPYRSVSPLLYFLLPSVFVPNAEVQRIISLSVCSPRIISAYHT